MKIEGVQNYGQEFEVDGKEMKTIIMTDLFRDCSFAVAKEEGLSLYPEGMIEALQEIKKRGFKLAKLTRTKGRTGCNEFVFAREQ